MRAGGRCRDSAQVDVLYQRVTQRIAALDGKTRAKLKYIQHAMQSRVASMAAVAKHDHDRDLDTALRDQSREHEEVGPGAAVALAHAAQGVKDLNVKLRDAKRKQATAEEAVRVGKIRLDRAKQLLLKNGLVSELNVAEMEKVAAKDVRACAHRRAAHAAFQVNDDGVSELDKLRKALLVVTQERSSLEKQLRTQKTIRLENLRAFQHDRQARACPLRRKRRLAGAAQQDQQADGGGGGAEADGRGAGVCACVVPPSLRLPDHAGGNAGPAANDGQGAGRDAQGAPGRAAGWMEWLWWNSVTHRQRMVEREKTVIAMTEDTMKRARNRIVMPRRDTPAGQFKDTMLAQQREMQELQRKHEALLEKRETEHAQGYCGRPYR